MKPIEITVFNCEKDEAEAFRELSPRFDIVPVIVSEPARHGSIPCPCSRCVSVGHKSRIAESDLSALQRAGVTYICTRSIGYDHIDSEAAQRLGITIENVAYPPDGVADYTLMLILMALRSVKSTLKQAAHNDFRLPPVRGKELNCMTVGVVGAGHIGRAVIQRLRAFGCHVLVCDINNSADSVSLHELLEKSDVVTLHVPLNADTHHLICKEQFKMMKQDAILVNTARGALVDTEALLNALENHRLGGAALDVLEGEEAIFYSDCSQKPLSHPFLPRLQKMPNVIITPHTAYYTRHVLYDTVEKTLLNCLTYERKQNHE
ncbi:MAG: D-lactate dehydrogenase VanH-B [Lachnospiraceae bacterium]|nr:D-lactate dehydrogenase VanH-B [Lachnospiraceae bacterium]